MVPSDFCKDRIVVESTLWRIQSLLVVDAVEYWYIVEIASVMCLSFVVVCSIVQLNVIHKLCHLLRFCWSRVPCIKVSRALWSIRITNLFSLSWASKKSRLSIIANNSFWIVGYLICTGLNVRLWKQDTLSVSRVACPIHYSSPMSLASYIRHFGSLYYLFQGLYICKKCTSSFSLLKAWSWMSV